MWTRRITSLFSVFRSSSCLWNCMYTINLKIHTSTMIIKLFFSYFLLQALLSCPTSSITTEKPAHDILEVQKTFPIPVDKDRIPVIHLFCHTIHQYTSVVFVVSVLTLNRWLCIGSVSLWLSFC